MLFHFAMEKQIHLRKSVLFHCQENFDADLAPALGPQADLDEIDAFTVQEESTQHRDPK